MAEIVPFPVGWQSAERALRLILNRSVLSPEAAEWVQADAWPRLKNMIQNWKMITTEDDTANKAIKNALDNNMLKAITTLLELEIELYEARFGKSAGRL